MYHAHFKLREEPFGVSPDARFFYHTEQHREAVATLFGSIQQARGFALLVGQPGLGKTSVIVQLMRLLKNMAEIAYLPHPYFDRTNVLEAVLEALGVPPTSSSTRNHYLFCEYLMKVKSAGKRAVVIFDEAQELNRDTLEAIRMLSNYETPQEKLLQVVIVGQPVLSATLKQRDCDQVRQRLNVIARLTPLTTVQVFEYMAHRLRVAGVAATLFEVAARRAVACAAHGVPRNVNTICYNSLTIAYGMNHQRVGIAAVAEALADLRLPDEDALAFIPASEVFDSQVSTAATGRSAI